MELVTNRVFWTFVKKVDGVGDKREHFGRA